jgi:hypothetical protein
MTASRPHATLIRMSSAPFRRRLRAHAAHDADPEAGADDVRPAAVHAVLDEALVCHVGYVGRRRAGRRPDDPRPPR